VHFGYHLRAGASGVATDEPRAVKLWRLACRAGAPSGCTALHLHHSEHEQWRAALGYGSQACLRGDAESCASMADLAFEGRGTRRNQAAAFGLWLRACKMRDYAACDRAGSMLLFGMPGSRKDPAAACHMLSHACEAPGRHGCGNLAQCFEHGLGGRKDLGEAIALNLKACLERGDASGCVRAGLLVEESSANRAHRSKALDLYERGCAMPPDQSCMSLDELQRYLPDAYSAEGLDRRACQNAPASALACYNAAIGHERGYRGTPDRERAKSLLERACEEGGLRKACRAPRLGRPQRI
jgi:TPR repeat protein